MYKVLIADDEPDIVSMLKDYFEINGYLVLTAVNGQEAIAQTAKKPDIILLDINMPDVDGLEVCRKIRDYVACPILFLTARIEDSDKIHGFAVGGDDYIVKPFSIEELGARVAAHIRREQRGTVAPNAVFYGELVIDYTAKSAAVKGRTIAFTKKEFELLELLSLNAGMVFDKEKIYERVWGYDAEGDSAVVAEYVRRIRAKLAEHGEEYHIETVWGMGYKWVR